MHPIIFSEDTCLNKPYLNATPTMGWLEKIFSGFWLRVILIALACFIAGCFPLKGNAQQKEWVTPAVNAPHLVQRIFYSATVKTDVSFHVYTPESYDVDQERRFPVIYWLHGHGGGVKAMPQVVEYFDRAMREGKIPPAIVVFPNGMPESMWSNSKDGKVPMETVVIDELVPQVDATLRTIPSRAGRLIEGFSMGGYGAARLGIKHPEIFGAISMLGAGPMQLEFNASVGPGNLASDRTRILHDVYGNDQEYFRALSPWVLAEKYADAVRGKSKVRIVVGSHDVMQGPNQDFAAHLSRLQIPHDFYLVPNVVHNPIQLFQALGETNWDFYRAVLGGKASTAHSKARGDTTESKQHYAAPGKSYFAHGSMQRRQMICRLPQFGYDGAIHNFLLAL